jgi:hypothetical protein
MMTMTMAESKRMRRTNHGQFRIELPWRNDGHFESRYYKTRQIIGEYMRTGETETLVAIFS